MNKETVKSNQVNHVLQSWSVQKGLDPLVIEKAEGIYMWDTDGNRYSDMSSQLVNLNIGHGNKEVVEAIQEQAGKMCYLAPHYGSDVRGELAKMILDRMPDTMGKIFFTNGGADANENAVKMARMFTGKHKVFSRYRSYHGSTYGAGNLTGEPRGLTLQPSMSGFVKFMDPYFYRESAPFASEEDASKYYVEKLREQVIYEGEQNVAAIVLETVTGSNGVIIPPKGYLPGVRAICDEFGILMICDEVMTGFGRTGKLFGFENFDVVPDMVSFAKGVTCGYVQLGGVCVSKKVADYFDDHMLSCGLTYSGHPLACAAGIACLKFYDDAHILDNVNKVGAVLGSTLEKMKEAHPCVGDVRYIGLFSAVELVKDKTTKEALVPYGKDPEKLMKQINGKLAKLGFMTYTHENMILVSPPLIITEEQLVEELGKLDQVLTEVDGMI